MNVCLPPMTTPNRNPKPERRCFTFRLRTLFILVATAALLAAQWPFVVEAETKTTAGPPGTTAQIIWIETRYQLTTGFLVTLAAELIAIVGWFTWQRLRSHRTPPTTQP